MPFQSFEVHAQINLKAHMILCESMKCESSDYHSEEALFSQIN